MDSSKFIGRNREINRLDKCMTESQAQLVIVYGRRRVGKTYLIDSYFDNEFSFRFSGVYGQDRASQLKNFAVEMSLESGTSCATPADWTEAFVMLRKYLSAKLSDEKKTVFFDEMPWMDTQKSGFLPAFEWFWNNWAARQQNLVFIVCGSATSWMMDNIANNKGALFNRQTCRLYLEPFSLYETEQYLQSKNINWSRYQITECYMIMGGMPYYLNLLDHHMTLEENIDNLFFRNKAELWDEFHHLYHTLFSNSEMYIRIVEALSKKKNGLTRKEIITSAKVNGNGTLTKALNNLIDSDFVRAYNFYGHSKRETIYQLRDYYTAFYFKYIRANYGRDAHFWKNMLDNPSRRAWSGLTFEQVCKDHISQIKKKLGIAGVLSDESTWYVRSNDVRGAQIDMLIDRRDNVINICEMKFSIKEYEIDKKYDAELREKIDSFITETGSMKTITLTMITTYGVKQNKYSSIVRSHVTLDDLFEDWEK